MKENKARENNPKRELITYGYARVSSVDQNEDRQLISLREAGVADTNILIDHKSGKDFNRPSWRKLYNKLHCGDTLFITSLDRLGRNYEDMLEIWRKLTKKKGVNIKVLDMPFLDSSNNNGLTQGFITDLFLQILSYVAQMEREHIRKRQKEGIAAAHLRGVKFGRPSITLPENFNEIADLFSCHQISLREASRRCGFSTSTFRRYHNLMAK